MFLVSKCFEKNNPDERPMEHGGISNHCDLSSDCARVRPYKQVNSCLGGAEILERFFPVHLFGGCVL